jgi:ceramide glucosyltransferase
VQQYPEFEILFGLSNPNDPALEDIERLRREFPSCRISVHRIAPTAPNAKASVLAGLAKHARYPFILASDSDIVVDPGYLRAVTTPLADPAIGLVTCLYRGTARSWPARAEALAIATEFAPSVLVARFLGVVDFAMGSTMLLRAETLRNAGGFESIAEYLADDYQLGRRVAALGGRIELAPVVVATSLGSVPLAHTWRHQLRWSRTIRVSRRGGYYGYMATHATVWALVALAGGQWWAAAVALGLRMAAGIAVGTGVLRDPQVVRYFWLIPFRDLFGFAIWAVGLFGDRVTWRGRKLRLSPDGRICEES